MQVFGSRSVIITGAASEQGKTGFVGWDREIGEFSYTAQRIGKHCHGTGDLFAAVFTGALTSGRTIPDAATLAARFVERVIAATPAATPFGVDFESQLPWLWQQL